MIVYRDVLTGDEMFSDIYKITEVDGLYYEVDGKVVTRTEGQIDDALIGGNASAEFCEDQPDGKGVTFSGVDVVLNHHLQETSFTKETFKQYIKDYMKAIKCKLEKDNPDRVKPFMSGAPGKVKDVLGKFKNLQFFTGESMNPDGLVALLDYREDGQTPYLTFFKDGLELEKC